MELQTSTSRYADEIAEELGLGYRAMRVLEDAALISDGRPSLRSIDDFPAVMEIILHAGERWDGGEGAFPGALAGEQIPIESRVLAVSRWLAMVEAGPDRLELQRALADLRARAGTEFDPTVVDVAARVLMPDLEPLEGALEAA